MDNGNGPGGPIPYSPRDTSSWTGRSNGWGGRDPYDPNKTTHGVTCSGEITAHFTWKPDPSNPNEPPPDSVIVQEDCMVQCYLSGGTGSTGSYATGLGQSGTGSGPYDTVYTRYDKRFTVQSNPGTSFSLSPGCSPSVSATVAATGACGGLVEYSATAYNVTLDLGGTTPDTDGSLNILIGQGCSGTLSASPATLSNFQWTIPGETFASFEMGNTPGDFFNPSHPYGRVNYLSAADLTNPTPHWFWKHGTEYGDSQTVSCTAQASINGVPIGTVMGKKVVNVWRPYQDMAASTHNGVNVISRGTTQEEIHADMEFEGAVGTPALFWIQYGGAGTWLATQLCWINRSLDFPWNPGGIGGPGNGEATPGYVLDGEFNYASREAPPAPWPANSTKIQKMPFTWSDEPSVGPGAITAAIISDKFKVYQMYQPPGTDVQWVPLYEIDWAWDYDDYLYAPNPNGTLTITNNTPTSDFPTWEGYYPGTNTGH